MKIVKLSQSLPQPAYQPIQVQQNEAKIAGDCGISLITLMERAGAAVFSHIQSHYSSLKSLLVISGKGNNGGDGFVVAKLAAMAGIKVTVVVIANEAEIKGDALTALQLLNRTSVTLHYLHEAKPISQLITRFQGDLVVDGLFGVGFRGHLSSMHKEVIGSINGHDAPVVSIDIPSGLNADTGHCDSLVVSAQQTITFIVYKRGLLTAQAVNCVGELYLAGLGIGEDFLKNIHTSAFIQGYKNLPVFIPRKKNSHKGSIGLVLAIGGNKDMPGAIRLSAEAALRSGASLVAVACHQDIQTLVCAGRPEIMLAQIIAQQLNEHSTFLKAKVVVIGPGLGQDNWAQKLFLAVLSSTKRCVVDADALSLLSQNPIKRDDWVLTPHPGEAANLLNCSIDDIENDRFVAVKAITDKYGGICVLKGAGTLISDGKSTWINTSGNAGMASGGMGDVLSGIIAALLIQLVEPLAAVRFAVYIHGLAADIVAKNQGQRGLLASDLFPEIQRLVNLEK